VTTFGCAGCVCACTYVCVCLYCRYAPPQILGVTSLVVKVSPGSPPLLRMDVVGTNLGTSSTMWATAGNSSLGGGRRALECVKGTHVSMTCLFAIVDHVKEGTLQVSTAPPAPPLRLR
jgi:hypothetical protein